MKIQIKRLLSIILSLTMVMSVAPMHSMAAVTETAFTIGEGGSATASGVGDSWRWKGETLFTKIGGLGGKATSDTAQVYNYNWNGTDSLSGDVRYGYPLTDFTLPITVEVSMLVTGGAIGYVGFGSGYVAVSIDSEGNAVCGLNTKVSTNVTPGIWHKIALTISENNIKTYLDGVLVENYNRGDVVSTYKGLNFNIKKDSTTGMVAFDDAVKFEAEFDANRTGVEYIVPTIDIAGTGAILTDDGKISYQPELVVDTDTLMSLVCATTPGDSVRIFSDCNFASEITANTALTGNECVVVESAYKVLNYYPIEKENLQLKGIDITTTDGAVTAKASFDNSTSNQRSAVMILVLKDENGIIQKLTASPETTMEPGQSGVTLEASIQANEALTPEVFFIKSWSGRQRLFDNIYSE